MWEWMRAQAHRNVDWFYDRPWILGIVVAIWIGMYGWIAWEQWGWKIKQKFRR